ncbi:MAG TPA: aldehyde dehydrogenase family protein [Vicinamibacterales bacterium]|nr:aldehyde dehydrogenase family protein [Vicinamibacterales bacterium]
MSSTFPNLIDGRSIDSADRNVDRNPSNLADVVGEFARASEADLDEAIAAARRAFTGWSRSTPQQRFDVLDRAGTEILARKDELGHLLAREQGKPLADGIGEAARAGAIFKFFAGEALRIGGEKFDSVRSGIDVEVTREPLGVVAAITPWNFPLAIPAWKIAPALAFGNTVVFKPAELVPASPWMLVDIVQRAGLPPGVVNLVMGPGSVLGPRLASSPDVDAVSFTGSQDVGPSVAVAAVTAGSRVQLEMGGKNPLVVLDDADLGTAVSIAINGAFFQAGQRCTASSRLIVTEGIHDRFVAAMIERMKTLVIDDALKPGTEIGPVVDERQLGKNVEYLDIGKAESATLAHGGERLRRDTDGYYMAPAIFTGTSPGMRINREEIFGPIAAVIRVKNYDEALAVANDTPYGLSAGIATTSLKYATHFKRHSSSGLVMVNLPTAGLDYHVPFGGRKKSSYGPREQGSYAREFYTIVKTAYVAT